MNQYNPNDNLSVQPAEEPIFYVNSPPSQFFLPPPTPPTQASAFQKIPLIPLLKKHQESANLQLACLQKGVYFSKSTLHTITNPLALDRELNLLQLADILQYITTQSPSTGTFSNTQQQKMQRTEIRKENCSSTHGRLLSLCSHLPFPKN